MSTPESFDPFTALESVDVVIGTLSGIKQKIVDSGFSDEAAEQLVIAMFKQGLEAASQQNQRKARPKK